MFNTLSKNIASVFKFKKYSTPAKLNQSDRAYYTNLITNFSTEEEMPKVIEKKVFKEATLQANLTVAKTSRNQILIIMILLSLTVCLLNNSIKLTMLLIAVITTLSGFLIYTLISIEKNNFRKSLKSKLHQPGLNEVFYVYNYKYMECFFSLLKANQLEKTPVKILHKILTQNKNYDSEKLLLDLITKNLSDAAADMLKLFLTTISKETQEDLKNLKRLAIASSK